MLIDEDNWSEVFNRDKGYCQYCGKDLLESLSAFNSTTVDNIISVSVGGSDELNNRVLSCSRCNQMLSKAYELSRANGLTTFDARKDFLERCRKKDTEFLYNCLFELMRVEQEKKTAIFRDLNPKYTFEQFVVGNSNQFAHAAAMEVANNPAAIYNPLFICGGIGLGKSHLLQAIGHAIQNGYPDKRICFCDAWKFDYERIKHLRQRKMEQFRQYFRNIDVLLLTGLQYFSDKPDAQDEFSIIYDSLYEAHTQILIGSSLPPSKLPDFDRFLSSRFEGGLIAAIEPPDIETRLVILRKKAESRNMKIPDDVLNFIAPNSSCIRELEGYVIRIDAFSRLRNIPISLELARECFADLFVDNSSCADED